MTLLSAGLWFMILLTSIIISNIQGFPLLPQVQQQQHRRQQQQHQYSANLLVFKSKWDLISSLLFLSSSAAASPDDGNNSSNNSDPNKNDMDENVSSQTMASTTMTTLPTTTTTTTEATTILSSSSAVAAIDPKMLLRNCTFAGNAGFDPLGFVQTEAQLWRYREAEIKHARLAMLAAAGLPLSDLFDREISQWFGWNFFTSSAWHTFVLNRAAPVWWGSCLGLVAAVELYCAALDDAGWHHTTIAGRPPNAADPNYVPGKLNWDPLGLYRRADATQQEHLLEGEIQHGRLAMLGMAIYLIQEYVLVFLSTGAF